MSERAEQAVTEGFLDVIKSVFADASKAKKSDPGSWKRPWTTTNGLIKILTNTYGNPAWLERRGMVASPTVSMADMASHLVVDDQIPEDLANAILDHVDITKTILTHWVAAGAEHCQQIERALHNVGFDPTNTRAYPYYSNRLPQLLRGLKPLNLIAAYHDFTGLMGSVVVMPDGHLSIGTHPTRQRLFPTLTLEQVPAVANAVISVLRYAQEPPLIRYAPTEIYRSVRVATGRVSAEGHPVYEYISFMNYISEHNQQLAKLLDANYDVVDLYDYDEDTLSYLGTNKYDTTHNSLQPYNELTGALNNVALAAEYWLYRSVR